MKLSALAAAAAVAVATTLLTHSINAEVVQEPVTTVKQHENVPVHVGVRPESLGWQAPVVDKQLPEQKVVRVAVAQPKKESSVFVVQLKHDDALTSKKHAETDALESVDAKKSKKTHHHRQSHKSKKESAKKQEGKAIRVNEKTAEDTKSDSHALRGHDQKHKHHHHKHHKHHKHHHHKHHHHHKGGKGEKVQAANSGSSSGSGSSSSFGYSGEARKDDAAGDVYDPELEGMVSHQTYNETLIEEEARQVSAAVMTQMAESSPFRLAASKSLVFAAAVAGVVVGVIGIIVALFGLHRQHSEIAQFDLENDLQDPEAGLHSDTSAESRQSTTGTTGSASASPSTGSASSSAEESKEEDDDAEEEGAFTNA